MVNGPAPHRLARQAAMFIYVSSLPIRRNPGEAAAVRLRFTIPESWADCCDRGSEV